MAENSNIAWTDNTANFWWGCTKVDTGCLNCYAETMAERVGADVWGPGKSRRLVKQVWSDVSKWQRRAASGGRVERVFVSSMCDFFEEPKSVVDNLGRPVYIEVNDGKMEFTCVPTSRRLATDILRDMAWRTIDASPDLAFQLLTKRPENILRYWAPPRYNRGRRRENVWLGLSAATDDEYCRAILDLSKVRHLARYTFISVEPMTERILPRFDGYRDIALPDWIIVGGESGNHARPCRVDWIRRFVEASKRSRRGPLLFVKQLGANVPDSNPLQDPKGGKMAEWPAQLRVQQVPSTERISRGSTK